MFKAVAIGASAGGIPLLRRILAALPANYPLALLIVVHLPAQSSCNLVELFSHNCALPIRLATDKARLKPGHVYIAPPDYHLLVETCDYLALSVEAPVQSVRPSIDVLLQSAAEVFEKHLIAVILSGANSDGAAGMALVKELGGLTIVLNPLLTDFNTMPKAVLENVDVDYVANVEEIIALLQATQDQ
jgi:two-component system, chemotaxis family, protein-glutamate methylesterase/glutaminase